MCGSAPLSRLLRWPLGADTKHSPSRKIQTWRQSRTHRDKARGSSRASHHQGHQCTLQAALMHELPRKPGLHCPEFSCQQRLEFSPETNPQRTSCSFNVSESMQRPFSPGLTEPDLPERSWCSLPSRPWCSLPSTSLPLSQALAPTLQPLLVTSSMGTGQAEGSALQPEARISGSDGMR